MLLADVGVFAACAALILASGTRLVRHADRLATLTGLGGTRVGVLLLATATSIPEVVSATTAATLRLPNLAAGGLLGTVLLNLSVLAFAELVTRRPGLVADAAMLHPKMLWACFFATAVAASLVVLGDDVPLVLGIGLGAPLLVAGYLFIATRPSQPEPDQPLERAGAPRKGLPRTLGWFAFHAVVVGIAALLLPRQGAAIADASGLARAFVGTAFVAFATTLPELAVGIAAIRLGSRDLAVGNAFGSLLFNLALLGLLDLVYAPGSVLADADPAHGLTAVGGLLMMTILRASSGARVSSRWPAATLLLVHGVFLVFLYLAAR